MVLLYAAFAVSSLKGVGPHPLPSGCSYCREGQVNLPAALLYGLGFDMPTYGVLRSAHQFRRFGYHSRVILPVFAVVAYALARVYSSLLTPVIAHWSRGRGLFRKVHPLAGQVRLVRCRCRRKPPSFGPCGPLRVPSNEPTSRLEPTYGRVRPTRFSLFNGPLALCHVLLTIIYF